MITVKSPIEFSVSELGAFSKMVIEGGEVESNTLPALIDQALLLATVYLDSELVGVGAIKRPYTTHRAKVFKKAGSLLNPSEFEFELGWIFVHEQSRGKHLASRLIRSLMQTIEGRAIYSTTRTNNDRMYSSLQHAGFVQEGAPYPSKMNEHGIQLFISL